MGLALAERGGAPRRRGDPGRRQRRAARRRPGCAGSTSRPPPSSRRRGRSEFARCARAADGGRVADFRPATPPRARSSARARAGSSCAWSRPRTSSPASPPRGRDGQIVVGFAAEHGGDGVERARGKLERKGARRDRLQRRLRRRRSASTPRDNEVTIVEPRGRAASRRSAPRRRSPRRSSTGSRRCASRRPAPARRLQRPRRRLQPAPYTACMPTLADAARGASPPTTLYRRGIELLEDGRLRRRPTVPLAEAARRAPEKSSVREALGRAYFRNRQFAEAAAEFEAVVETHPVNDYAHFCLGRALSLTGQRRARPPPPGAGLEPAPGAPRLPHLPRAPAPRQLPEAGVAGAGPAGQPRRGRASTGARVAEIGAGMLVLLGVAAATTPRPRPTASPTRCGRCGSSTTPTGRMNEPLGEREVLCVSQFTLYGDTRRGNRPELRRRGAAPSWPSRSTSASASAGRRARRLRRPHGRRARQRRPGDAAARGLSAGAAPVERRRACKAGEARGAILAHLLRTRIRVERWARARLFFGLEPGRKSMTRARRDSELDELKSRSRAASPSSIPAIELIAVEQPGRRGAAHLHRPSRGGGPGALRAGHRPAPRPAQSTTRSRSPRRAPTGR